MSDLALLLFGCVVSFVAVAGFYVSLRAGFTGVDETPGASKPTVSTEHLSAAEGEERDRRVA